MTIKRLKYILFLLFILTISQMAFASYFSKSNSSFCFIATSQKQVLKQEKLSLETISNFKQMFNFTPSFGVIALIDIPDRLVARYCYSYHWIHKSSIEVLKHELTHTLFDEWFKKNFPNRVKREVVPNWFNEGIAVYAEGQEKLKEILKVFDNPYSISDLINMPKLGYLFTRDNWYNKIYYQGGLLIHYISDRMGARKIGQFARLVGQGFSQTKALKNILDKSTLREIDLDFKNWIIHRDSI